MGNPSTIWAQLSTPNSPAGSIPFVASDGITISTDVVNFNYGLISSQSMLGLKYQITFGFTAVTAVGPTVVSNTPSGRIKIPAGQASCTVSCSCLTNISSIFTQLESQDATAISILSCVLVPNTQTFVLTLNAAATGVVQFSYLVVN